MTLEIGIEFLVNAVASQSMLCHVLMSVHYTDACYFPRVILYTHPTACQLKGCTTEVKYYDHGNRL